MSTPNPTQTAAVMAQLLGSAPEKMEAFPGELVPECAQDPDLSGQLLLDLQILKRDYQRRGLSPDDVLLVLGALLDEGVTIRFCDLSGLTAAELAPGEPLTVPAEDARLDAMLSATIAFQSLVKVSRLVQRERAAQREGSNGS